jgi:chromosome segregation ATPase
VTTTIDSKSTREKEILDLNELTKSLRQEKESLEELLATLQEAKRQSDLMVAEVQSQKETAENDKKACQLRNKEFAKAIRGMQSELASIKKRIDGRESDEEENLSLKVMGMRAEIAGLRSELQIASDSLLEANSMIDRLRQNSPDCFLDRLKEFETASQRRIGELEEGLLEKTVELNQLKSANSLLMSQISSLRTEVESLRAQSGVPGDGYENVIASLNSKFESEITRWNSERSQSERAITDLKNELKQERDRVVQLENAQASSQSLINQLTVEMAQLHSQKKVLETESVKLKGARDVAQAKNSEMEVQVQTLLSRVSDLERLALVGEKSTARCSELQKQLHELHETVIAPLTVKAQQFESTQAELDAATQALTALRIDHEKLLRDHEHVTASLRALATLQPKFEELQAKFAELEQQHSDLTLVSNEQASSLSEKEKTNVKLKVLLNNYVVSDDRKQRQIDELQAEIGLYAKRFASASQGSDNAMLETVVRLEAQVKELEQRLHEGQASAELHTKNAQLAAMLEKSTRLYSELLEHRESAAQAARAFRLSLDKTLVIETGAPAAPRDGALMLNAYLKSTLIQFFGQDAVNRSALIPLILELVGCTPQQVRAAQRQWERSNHLINKTVGFFGL